jgi:ATP-dependent protease ClpP protease subunit
VGLKAFAIILYSFLAFGQTDQKLLPDAQGIVHVRQGQNLLIKKEGNAISIAKALANMEVAPLGKREGDSLVIEGQIGPHTPEWIKSFLGGSALEANKPKCESLNLSTEQRSKIRQEDRALLGNELVFASQVEAVARVLCLAGINKIVLNSPGGTIIHGKTVGFAVELAGINTEVKSKNVCASACNEIYMHGKERFAGKYSMFMFHLPRIGRTQIQILPQSRKILPVEIQSYVRESLNVYITGDAAQELGLVDTIVGDAGLTKKKAETSK